MQFLRSIISTQRKRCCLTLAIMAVTAQSYACAAPTTSDMVEALEKGNVFAAGISVSARVAGTEALISTYRNSKATSDDCKIEALLAAKTVFDLGPEGISRVKVYFFELTLDKYKEVSVSKGDVLSFQSGQIKQQDLLSSLTVQERSVADASENVANYLDASHRRPVRRDLLTRIRGQNIEILTNLENWVDDSECKFEAIKLANRALSVARGYKRVKITFVDPVNRREDRVIEFDADQLKTLAQNVDALVASVPLSVGKDQWMPSERFDPERGDPARLYAVAGFKQKERAELLDRIQKLSKKGVGVKPFLGPFLQMEDSAVKENQEVVDAALAKLNTSLDEQEARAAAAKEAKPSKVASPTKPAVTNNTPSSGGGNEPSSMDNPYIRKQILADPAGSFEYYVRRWRGKDKKPEDFPNYYSLMKVYVNALTEAKRPAEAKIYQLKVDEVKKLHPDW
ncbi:MAG: hypothetical protein SGJ27_22245 [Candidatus Melainabacteria bacterium]|nr:hypothetical protein [Candidatus Melainabacteria bacterium]